VYLCKLVVGESFSYVNSEAYFFFLKYLYKKELKKCKKTTFIAGCNSYFCIHRLKIGISRLSSECGKFPARGVFYLAAETRANLHCKVGF
jgi:hypothetical protein